MQKNRFLITYLALGSRSKVMGRGQRSNFWHAAVFVRVSAVSE